MYVESFIPAKSNNKNIILIHGGGQSGSGFITTADGRRGWLHDFLSHGYSAVSYTHLTLPTTYGV